MVIVSPLMVKSSGLRVHSRSSTLKSPPFFKASLTPSMKEFSDVPVHDAIRKLRHPMMSVVERLIVIVFIDANIRKISIMILSDSPVSAHSAIIIVIL